MSTIVQPTKMQATRDGKEKYLPDPWPHAMCQSKDTTLGKAAVIEAFA